MSYILDALRKSEQERRQAHPAAPMPEVPRDIGLRPRGTGFWLTTVAVAAVAVMLVAYWMSSANVQGTPAAVAASRTAAAPAAGEAAALPSSEARETPAALRTAPALERSSFAVARRPAVRDLAEEARIDPPATKAPVPAVVETPAPPVATPPPASSPPVKFLHAMPAEFSRSLPKLAVTIHIYASQEADRILYINDRQYHAGDRVRDGIRVEEIVEDGAVLSYRGRRFKLPRPS